MDILLAAVSYAVCAFGALLAADFLTGVLHWTEDTWLAPGQSPLLDRWITNDNIEHHRSPGKIRAGRYWQTNKVCVVLAAAAAAIFALAGVHTPRSRRASWAGCSVPDFCNPQRSTRGITRTRTPRIFARSPRS